MKEYAFKSEWSLNELGFGPVRFQFLGNFNDYIADIARTRGFIEYDASEFNADRMLNIFDEAVVTAFHQAIYSGNQRGTDEIPYYIAAALLGDTIEADDDEHVIEVQKYCICSTTEMTLADARTIFEAIDLDEVNSYIEDLVIDDIIDIIKLSCKRKKVGSSANSATASELSFHAASHIEEVEAEEVEAAASSSNDNTLTAPFLFAHFADALNVGTIQNAVQNTWSVVDGSYCELNSLEFDDADNKYIQRTVVRYDLKWRKKYITTTEANDGVVTEYKWRTPSLYRWALSRLTDDGGFDAETLGKSLLNASACKDFDVEFIPTTKEEANAAKGLTPKLADAYAAHPGEMWMVPETDKLGDVDTYYYLADPEQEKTDVYQIGRGAVKDYKSEMFTAPLRDTLSQCGTIVDAAHLPADVMVILMVLGIAPRTEGATETTSTKAKAPKHKTPDTMDTPNSNPEPETQTTNTHTTMEQNTTTATTDQAGTPADLDPIALMMEQYKQMLAEQERQRQQQEADAAKMRAAIQQAQEEQRRQKEEAERRAREEAERKQREEQERLAREKAEREEAERKQREEQQRLDDIVAAEKEKQKRDEHRTLNVNRHTVDGAAILEAELKQKQEEAWLNEARRRDAFNPVIDFGDNEVSLPDDMIECRQMPEIRMWTDGGYIVWLFGPAGSGKDITAMQVAKKRGLKYYSVNAVLNPYDITGYMNVEGTYVYTQFAVAWEFGGVLSLTELGASDSQVLNIVNEGLSNGYMVFGNRRVRKSPDCIIIASDNTTGTGATSIYTGRQRIDEATLNRFVLIEVGYDHRVELRIADGNEMLVEFMEDVRSAFVACGMDIVRSYRQTSQMQYMLTHLDQYEDWEPAAPYIHSKEEQAIHRCIHRYMDNSDFVLIARKLRCARNVFSSTMRRMAEAIETGDGINSRTA